MLTEAQANKFLVKMAKRVKKENKDIIDCLAFIARSEGIKVRFLTNRWGGQAFCSEERIEIGLTGISISHAISQFFHEFSHIICARENLFPAYHRTKLKMSKADKLAVLRTGLRAELFVDKMAKSISKSYFPGCPFTKAYNTKMDRQKLQTSLREGL